LIESLFSVHRDVAPGPHIHRAAAAVDAVPEQVDELRRDEVAAAVDDERAALPSGKPPMRSIIPLTVMP